MSSYIPAPLKWHIRLHLFTNDKLYGLLKGLIKDKKITSTENMSDLSRNTVIFQQSLHSLEINFERKINWEGLLFITFNSSSGYFEQFMKLHTKKDGKLFYLKIRKTYLNIDQSTKTSKMIIDMGNCVETWGDIFDQKFRSSSVSATMRTATATASTTQTIIIEPIQYHMRNLHK